MVIGLLFAMCLTSGLCGICAGGGTLYATCCSVWWLVLQRRWHSTPTHKGGRKSATVAYRYVGVTASVTAAGVKGARDTAFIGADALPLSEQCGRSHTTFPGVN